MEVVDWLGNLALALVSALVLLLLVVGLAFAGRSMRGPSAEEKPRSFVAMIVLGWGLLGYGATRFFVGGYFALVGALFSVPSSGGWLPTRDAASLAATRTLTLGALVTVAAGAVSAVCTTAALLAKRGPARVALGIAFSGSVLAHAVAMLVAGITDVGSLWVYGAIATAAIVELVVLALLALAR